MLRERCQGNGCSMLHHRSHTATDEPRNLTIFIFNLDFLLLHLEKFNNIWIIFQIWISPPSIHLMETNLHLIALDNSPFDVVMMITLAHCHHCWVRQQICFISARAPPLKSVRNWTRFSDFGRAERERSGIGWAWNGGESERKWRILRFRGARIGFEQQSLVNKGCNRKTILSICGGY